ncbi:MAG: hypothetical protein ACRCU5_00340 [Rhizobiaceae bacterium]
MRFDPASLCEGLAMVVTNKLTRRIGLALALFVAMPIGQSLAESYSGLVKQGYKTGKLTKGPSGAYGWIVTDSKKKFFCKMNVASVYVGKTGMVSFTSSGRKISIDRKVFENAIGGPDPTIPQLEDLEAGRPNNRDVGACTPRKK